MPAGNWALVVKRDYFNKVSGGVRQQEKLDAHSELVKIRSGPDPKRQRRMPAASQTKGVQKLLQICCTMMHERRRIVWHRCLVDSLKG